MSIFTAFSSIVGSAVTSHINRWLLHFSLHSIKFRIEPINKGFAVRNWPFLPTANLCHTPIFIDFHENRVYSGLSYRSMYIR